MVFTYPFPIPRLIFVMIRLSPHGALTTLLRWMLSLTLWMRTAKDVSEYNRVEVFYDVLLPWLMEGNAEPMALQMVRESRSDSCWQTAQRSNVSGTRSVLDAIRYILSAGRVSLTAIKSFKSAMRFEAYRKSVEDLVTAARRFDPPRESPMWTHIQELCTQGIDPKSLNFNHKPQSLYLKP